MSSGDTFQFRFSRYSANGVNEVVPAYGDAPDMTNGLVWALPMSHNDGQGNEPWTEQYDSLIFLLRGVGGTTATFEIGYFQHGHRSASIVPQWIVLNTISLTSGVPYILPFPYEGATIYVRKTGGTLTSFELLCTPKQAVIDTLGTTGVVIKPVENDYVQIRSFSGAVSDTEPPVGGSMVSLTGVIPGSYTEVRYSVSAVSGSPSPSQVRFRTWRRVTGTGLIDKIDEFVIDVATLTLAQASNPLATRYLRFSSDEIFVTATFPDGASQTMTGTVYARAISPASAGLQRSDLIYNQATGHPVVEPRGYDSSVDAEKVTQVAFECDLAVAEVMENTTGITANTYYYPGTSGYLMDGYDSINWEYDCTAANNGTITLSWEGSNDSAFTVPKVITKAGADLVAGANLAASPATAVNGTISGAVDYDNYNMSYIRLKMVVATGATGSVVLRSRRKVR